MSLNKLESYNEQIKNINDKIKNLENKIDKILLLLENDIKPNSEKMSNHINIIEQIFKFPLSFVTKNSFINDK